MDADSADFAVGPNSLVNSQNIRFGTTDFPAGGVGYWEPVGSTVLISSPSPSAQPFCIGGVWDEAGNRIIHFGWNSNGFHTINVYDITTGNSYVALYNSQVTGGMNFSKNALIHNCRVVNGICYFTDNVNPQRRFNIDAAVNMNYPGTYPGVTAYTSPVTEFVINLIRNPPDFPIIPQKQFDGSVVTNFTQNEAFLFAYRIIYRDFEVSKLSPFSRLINYNYVSENWNSISLTIQFDQVFDQDVLRIEIAALYLNSNKAFIVKTWDKNIQADAAEIAAHNAGITQLSYIFFNYSVGNLLDDAYTAAPFDVVPVLSKTLEIARDRLHLANNLMGYDTPNTTSLVIDVVDSGTTGVTKSGYDTSLVYREITSGTPTFNYVRVWLLLITELAPAGYYAVTLTEQIAIGGPLPSPLPLPATITTADIVFRGADQTAVIAYYDGLFVNFAPFSNNFDLTTSTTIITDISVDSFIPFKSDSTYQVGIVFYDFALRKCGLLTLDSLIAYIPDRNYALSSVASIINWVLSNANAVNEIPDWAYYFQVVNTKNLNTRFFEQAVTDQIIYARKLDTGEYDLDASYTTLVPASVALAISLDFLVSYGMGYVFNENDIIKIYTATPAIFQLRVLGVSGKYLIAQLTNIGSTAATNYLYEIRTPYQREVNEPMYENGQLFAILNPTTISRTYSTLTGSINGDVYLRTRTHNAVNYFVESMSPQDAQWRKWNTDASRPNYVDKLGQKLLESADRWSNTIIEGTETNGLSTFEALNQILIPQENGAIQKLQLTSKVQNEQGLVMLAICINETASLYLGEVQLVGQTGNAFVASASNVIGTINILKGSYGTINPESVQFVRGNVYWYSSYNGRYIQYSTNGLDPVSDFKMKKFWKLFSDTYLSLTSTEIEALGSRPFVFTGYDPIHSELLVSVPKLLNTPPRGYTPDYPNLIYPFDVWDGQAKSVVYKLNVNPNAWQGSYNIPAEYFITADNDLYSFKNGSLYKHNSTTDWNNYYGVEYTSRIMGLCNENPNATKVFNNLALECNLLPVFTYLMTEYPYVQTSDLMDFDWDIKEGVFYAFIYNNRETPTATGLQPAGLITGEKMRSAVLKFMIEWQLDQTPIQFRFITIGYNISKGHTT